MIRNKYIFYGEEF